MIRRLIINADDFGRSSSINEAVAQCHRSGVLTSASLMVNEGAVDEAVALARTMPELGVGLHLTLICGKAALRASEAPHLVGPLGMFPDNPIKAGLRYFWNSGIQGELEAEMSAQFAKFEATGLPLDHVNGHLHMHLHPTVLAIIAKSLEKWKIKRLRLTREPLYLNWRIARGRWWYRLSRGLIYQVLAAWAAPQLQARRVRFTQRVFGLLQDAHMDKHYLLRLIPLLPEGTSELYSHPSMDNFRHETEALLDPEVKQLLQREGIELIRYSDLP